MSERRVYGSVYPGLEMGDRVKFKGGRFETSDPELQRQIETSESFGSGRVVVIGAQNDPGAATPAPSRSVTPQEVAAMKRPGLIALAKSLGLTFKVSTKNEALVEAIVAALPVALVPAEGEA